ncbi:tyrosine/DOPA decarboxylase [Spatholobus suberectus]|nr:tyrosine/DOPA decarboxylase [Spatholobus suberectus]
MASKQEPNLPLRLLVDKEKNRVVVAEANGDLIDILFGFLTLPLGTIIRLVSKKQGHGAAEEIGCINNLYQSVENSDAEVFWNHICKRMLLCPRNPCEALCQKLKLKVDDTEPMKYFMCSNKCRRGGDWFLSTFAEAGCSCGKLMDKEMKLHGDSNEGTHGDGVFVKGQTIYLIFDDLTVLQSSPGNSVKQLVQLGYKNFHKLTEKFLNVGLKEILDILKQALTSKSPLSDVFLGNGESKQVCTFSPKLRPENQGWTIFDSSINLKVTVRKSKKTILYAEAEGDFVDFLFSFLTTPLGSILKLLDGNFSLGCMNNLYKSVKGLNPSWFTRSSGTPLLNLLVAPQFGCKRQPTQLREEDTPCYWYGTGVIKNNICYAIGNGVISKEHSLIQRPVLMKLFEPRSPDGTRESAVGFVRRPSLFVVWDDLQVTPLANTSSLSFLQKLNAPLDDLEEHELRIGETEALNLLGASLTSKAALTEGLFYLLKKPKEEAKARSFSSCC